MSGGGTVVTVVYTWPTDIPDPVLPFREEFDMPLVESTAEMGVRKTRPKYTEEDHFLYPYWPTLSDANKTDILAFFREIGWGGTIFEFPHPHTAEILNVRVLGKVAFQSIGASLWSLQLTLEKA